MDTFYGRNHAPIPQLDAESWRLRVEGLVGRPLEMSMDELRDRFPERSVVATLQCAGNRRADLMEVSDIPGQVPWGPGAISTARWSGVSLADVLAEAGVRPDAAHVSFTGADVSDQAYPPQHFGGSIPMAKATSHEVLLAWSMNGQSLPAVHGAPLRVVVPGWIGARSVKWLLRIGVQAGPSDNYFQTEYSILPPEADPHTAERGEGITLGPVAIHCAILRPGKDARLPAGPTEVAGFAYAGTTGPWNVWTSPPTTATPGPTRRWTSREPLDVAALAHDTRSAVGRYRAHRPCLGLHRGRAARIPGDRVESTRLRQQRRRPAACHLPFLTTRCEVRPEHELHAGRAVFVPRTPSRRTIGERPGSGCGGGRTGADVPPPAGCPTHRFEAVQAPAAPVRKPLRPSRSMVLPCSAMSRSSAVSQVWRSTICVCGRPAVQFHGHGLGCGLPGASMPITSRRFSATSRYEPVSGYSPPSV